MLQKFERFLRKMADGMILILPNLSPIFWSCIGIGLALSGTIVLYKHHLFLFPIFFCSAIWCDLLDGAAARKLNRKLSCSYFVDFYIADHIVDIILWLGLGMVMPKFIISGLALAFLNISTTFWMRIIFYSNTSKKQLYKLFPKSARVLLLIIGGFLSAYFNNLYILSAVAWIYFILMTATLLSIIIQTIYILKMGSSRNIQHS